VRIEFDPAKDALNRARHGVSLALARELDWDAALVWMDNRFDYDEVRMIALAPKPTRFATSHSLSEATVGELSVFVALHDAR